MGQYINGRCYDTDLKSKNLIRFEIDETISVKKIDEVETAKSNVKKLTPNLSRFVILIVGLYIFNNRLLFLELSKKTKKD